MQYVGHTAAIFDMVIIHYKYVDYLYSASLDGTVRVWDINVKYKTSLFFV